MPPPGAKIIGTVGDADPIEHTGGFVYEQSPGDFRLEWIDPPSDDYDAPGAHWTVYDTDLDPGIPDWGDIQDVADSIGMSFMELAEAFESADPMSRAYAYEAWAGYYGWIEFDSYPDNLYRSQVEKRYDEELYPSASWIKIKPVAHTILQTVSGPYVAIVNSPMKRARHLPSFVLPGFASPLGPNDHVVVFEITDEDDAYYVLVFSTKHAALGRYNDYDSSEPGPFEPTDAAFFKNNSDIEGIFPEWEAGDVVDAAEMVRRLSKWLE